MSLEGDPVQALRAIAHPVRLQILSLLTGVEMSAAEIARELDITQANASYHVRVLARAGELTATGTEQVRGGRAKKYRYVPAAADRTPREDRPSPSPTPDAAEASALLVEALSTEMRRRVRYRDLSAPSDLTDAELWLAPEVWQEVVDLVHRASATAHGAARPPHTPGTVPTSFSALLFQLHDDTAAPPGSSRSDS